MLAQACICAGAPPGSPTVRRLNHDGVHFPRLAGQPGQRHGGGPPGARVPGGALSEPTTSDHHESTCPTRNSFQKIALASALCIAPIRTDPRSTDPSSPSAPPAQICIQPTFQYLEALIEARPRNPRWNRVRAALPRHAGLNASQRSGCSSQGPSSQRALNRRQVPHPRLPCHPCGACFPGRAWCCACGSAPSPWSS